MEKPVGDSLVILPTYNEAGNLEEIVSMILGHPGFDLLVIDDNSPDGTGEIADRLAGQFGDRLTVEHRQSRRGLGTALVAGFRSALLRGYRFIFQMDADLSHDPASLPEMRRALDEADVVIGSRYAAGGRSVSRSPWRSALSQLGSGYSRLVLGLPVRDLTGGFKGFRREAVEAVMRRGIRSTGFSVQMEVTYRCAQAGFDIVEIPTTFRDRTRGRSKISLGILGEAVLLVARLRLSSGLTLLAGFVAAAATAAAAADQKICN